MDPIRNEDIIRACQGRQIHVHANPGARKTQVTKILDEILYVDVGAPAENGEANAHLEKFFTKIFGEPVRIIRGKQSKKKVLLREKTQ